MDEDRTPTRKGSPAIKVRVLPEEKATIEALARDVGLSASSYLRQMGLGYKPRGVVDMEQVQRLVAINGDLGRMGGLLKLWLTDDPKLDEFKPDNMRAIVRGLLKKLEAGQEELREIAKAVLIARP
ncbi:conjugal transfer transcriptional regulator TraJ [Sphingomonas sp. PAMC 26605]|uniref:conjugal transfer transcriptional regulator TraJ n=1 Tax=Sphingomonas sp. PAMC 26605 TaxID=1112214 RepID=UPI00026CB1B5|nr:conjugal transfer transcriptional regulator TraJ [Sphingomonas sp. PAMC 26605]